MSNIQQKYSQIINITEELMNGETVWKLIMSKPRNKNTRTKSITVVPVIIQDQKFCKCVFKEDYKDLTSNETHQDFLSKLPSRLQNEFFNLDVFTSEETYQCLQSKNEKLTILKKRSQQTLENQFTHDREKKIFLNPEAPYYKKLGLISGSGHIFGKGQKKYNQVNKYLEIISHLTEKYEPNKRCRVADMGSGKAYLTFAVYDFLKNYKKWEIEVTGYEARPDLVRQCNAIAKEAGYENLHFDHKSIDAIPPRQHEIVIALHACDIATDMAIAYGVKNKADIIILAPCCQKQIRKSIEINQWMSPILKNGILLERQAEILTDGLRALALEYHGYQTRVFEFVSLEHTAKNVMITATKGKKNPLARESFNRIKNEFGISEHYIERLLPF